MKGIKYDSEKPQLDLIPAEAIIELGKVLTFGQNKYGRANWANGIESSRLLSAAFRHLQQFNGGEDLDPESRLSHISHAMCNLAFLTWMLQNRPELDNRWAKTVKNSLKKCQHKVCIVNCRGVFCRDCGNTLEEKS